MKGGGETSSKLWTGGAGARKRAMGGSKLQPKKKRRPGPLMAGSSSPAKVAALEALGPRKLEAAELRHGLRRSVLVNNFQVCWVERFECVSSPDAVGARSAWARPPTSPLAESVFCLPSPPASERKALADVNITKAGTLKEAGAGTAETTPPLTDAARRQTPSAPRTLKL
eukprot:gene8574-10547_t